MKLLGLISIICFVAIAVFGFVGFLTPNNTAFMACLNSLAGGRMVCGLAFVHVNFYQNFSRGLVLALALLVAVLCYFALTQKHPTFKTAPVEKHISKQNLQVLHVLGNPLL